MPFIETSQIKERRLCFFLLIFLFDSSSIHATNYDLSNVESSEKDAAVHSSAEDISRTDLLYPPSIQRETDDTGDNLEAEKRRQAFMPMRGKKEPYWENNAGENPPTVELFNRGDDIPQTIEEIMKRRMGFLPMRGRKSFAYLSRLRQLQSQNSLLHPGLGSNQLGFLLQKNGFKPNELGKTFLPYEEATNKRVSGFFGMRGKKRLYPRGFSWHGYQAGKSVDQGGGTKREALFFASRGKRTPVDSVASFRSTSE